MIELRIKDNRVFMNHILKLDTFDNFFLKKADLDMKISYRIFGDLLEDEGKNITWGEVREDFFALIKGKATPRSMKIVLGANDTIYEKLAGDLASDINGFTLSINFDGASLKIVTGVNYKSFILDKSAEKAFDDSIYKFFEKKGIETE